MRQTGNQAILERQPVTRLPVMQELGLHARHVDTGRAFASAALALHAQIHRLTNRLRGQALGAKLPGHRQSQGIGAPARQMLFVAGDTVRRTHGAGIKLAAVPVVVAHLDRLAEALRRIATGARHRERDPVAGQRESLAPGTG